MGICFSNYPKTDDNLWCFGTLLVNREVFGHLLLTRQTKKSIKGASLWEVNNQDDDSDFDAPC
jgi:hypothetical protein